MESIIVFIIIIIVFNLLRRLADANRSKQAGSRRQGTAASMPFSTTKPTGQRLEGPFFHSTRLDGPYADYDDGETVDQGYDEDFQDKEGDEYPTVAIKEGAKAPEKPGMPAAVKKSGLPTAVSKNLRQILSNKNSLVAAFIFHEIIESPLAQNKSRKSAFKRYR